MPLVRGSAFTLCLLTMPVEDVRQTDRHRQTDVEHAGSTARLAASFPTIPVLLAFMKF